MSAFNTTFTITQPFLGAALEFYPALGSTELESLIAAYVPGSAPLSTKFSEVTIDFYNNAVVDLNSGALVKTYEVFPVFDYGLDEDLNFGLNDVNFDYGVADQLWDSSPSGSGTMSLEQSPEQFLCNDFADFDASFGLESPLLFTPSPASSTSASASQPASFSCESFGVSSFTAATQAPARQSTAVVSGRVSKKYAASSSASTKKDKRALEAEMRLPGFSIMTKDGIDVTNSAGRGTKTKEQREHAHLMRIMKACDACKKKKVRVST